MCGIGKLTMMVKEKAHNFLIKWSALVEVFKELESSPKILPRSISTTYLLPEIMMRHSIP